MDYETFVKGMHILQEAFEKELSQGTLDVYFEFLGHLTPAQLEKAARAHIAKWPWFPKINELLFLARDPGPTPIEVWQRLLQAAETGHKPKMDHAAARALAAVGGWEAICYTPCDELKFKLKDFKEVFLATREQEAGGRPELGPPEVPRLEG